MASRASNNIPPSLRKIWKDLDGRTSDMESRREEWTGKAIVAHDTFARDGWKMEDVSIADVDVGEDELVVEMVACGVCHTDVMCGSGVDLTSNLFYYPRVLGHEGSGYVRAVGDRVTVAKPGDAVLLSFDLCSSCESCKSGLPSLCYKSMELNFEHKPTFKFAGSKKDGSPDIAGRFFGQSSFANYSVVRQGSVVNATDLVKSKQELQMFAPLGCGLQTGSGTVTNVAEATEKDAIAIQGLGGVGLAAVMAAKISGCRIILGADRISSRLQLAKELGATHVIDTSKLSDGQTIAQAAQEICDGVGPNITIDTTGVPFLIKAAIEMTRKGGQIIQVGSAPPDFQVELPAFLWMNSGKSYLGAIEGNSISEVQVPKMIEWYREGRFPIEKLIKLMPAEDFEKAVHEMHSGETIKPVLVWS